MRHAWILVGVALSLAPAGLALAQPLATEVVAFEPRPVESWSEAQVELHRRGFSCGSIDGVPGPRTRSALLALQRRAGLAETGELDEATRSQLLLTAPAVAAHIIVTAELAELGTVPTTWLGKSGQDSLPYTTALEMVAERYRAAPGYLRRLNSGIDWETVVAGTVVRVPAVERATITGVPARIVIGLEARSLEVQDEGGAIVARFPVSIARKVESRPVGDLHVTVVAAEPNYTFDPEVFPESAEAAALGRKLILPPGPNNPVGRAWIGLDRPGYGIHGTPDPENVGRTESHGCFRLANWDAVMLLSLVHIGMTVIVEP